MLKVLLSPGIRRKKLDLILWYRQLSPHDIDGFVYLDEANFNELSPIGPEDHGVFTHFLPNYFMTLVVFFFQRVSKKLFATGTEH